MTAHNADDIDAAIQAIDLAHDTTRHIHAAECCIELGKYAEAAVAAVSDRIAKRALTDAATHIEVGASDIPLGYGRIVGSWLRARAADLGEPARSRAVIAATVFPGSHAIVERGADQGEPNV